MIPFNKPAFTGTEEKYVVDAMRSPQMSGDGPFCKQCQAWFERELGCARALLTPSATSALEMAAILADIQPGDEVIMPSFTFVSTANAFALRGATIVFVDIRPDTMNVDESLLETAITPKTKALVPVHYAGVGCGMDTIMDIANQHKLLVVEDAAQAMNAEYRGKALGTISQLGIFSFHETKNYTSGGEGGLLIINDSAMVERAEIIREKGANRSQFFRGMVDKYTWVDIGGSHLLNDLSAAYLWGQLESLNAIAAAREKIWNTYASSFKYLAEEGLAELPSPPAECRHNHHLFFLKLANLEERTAFIEHLKSRGVMAVFHYVPLHSAPAGRRLGRFHGEDRHTTREGERLVRLPIFHGMTEDELTTVVSAVNSFWE